MIKDDSIKVRVNSDTKKQAQNIISEMGLTISDAVNLYLYQIILHNGIPFTMEVPNKTTAEAIQEVEDYKAGKTDLSGADDVDSLFKELEADC